MTQNFEFEISVPLAGTFELSIAGVSDELCGCGGGETLASTSTECARVASFTEY